MIVTSSSSIGFTLGRMALLPVDTDSTPDDIAALLAVDAAVRAARAALRNGPGCSWIVDPNGRIRAQSPAAKRTHDTNCEDMPDRTRYFAPVSRQVNSMPAANSRANQDIVENSGFSSGLPSVMEPLRENTR